MASKGFRCMAFGLALVACQSAARLSDKESRFIEEFNTSPEKELFRIGSLDWRRDKFILRIREAKGVDLNCASTYSTHISEPESRMDFLPLDSLEVEFDGECDTSGVLARREPAAKALMAFSRFAYRHGIRRIFKGPEEGVLLFMLPKARYLSFSSEEKPMKNFMGPDFQSVKVNKRWTLFVAEKRKARDDH